MWACAAAIIGWHTCRRGRNWNAARRTVVASSPATASTVGFEIGGRRLIQQSYHLSSFCQIDAKLVAMTFEQSQEFATV